MGIQQKAGRLTPAMAVLVSGLLLITGCSDSRTSTSGASFQRNSWQEGNAANITAPQENAVLQPGESYTFQWIGGAGPMAKLTLAFWNGTTFVSQYQVTVPNRYSHRVRLPSSLPRGGYVLRVGTFSHHEQCFIMGSMGYASAVSPKVLVVTETPNPSNGTESQANGWHWDPGAGVAECNQTFGVNNCYVVDVNGQQCGNFAGGTAFSQFFSIGNMEQQAYDQFVAGASVYFQPENSKSNQAAAAAQMKPDAEAAPEGFVQISFETDAKDDKSVQHIAHATVGGGR